jgi:hypothetical protein
MVTTQWWSFLDSSKNVKVIEGGGTIEVVDADEFGREGGREERLEEDELELELVRDKS